MQDLKTTVLGLDEASYRWLVGILKMPDPPADREEGWKRIAEHPLALETTADLLRPITGEPQAPTPVEEPAVHGAPEDKPAREQSAAEILYPHLK